MEHDTGKQEVMKKNDSIYKKLKGVSSIVYIEIKMELHNGFIIPTDFSRENLMNLSSKSKEIKKQAELEDIIREIKELITKAINQGKYQVYYPGEEQFKTVVYWTEAVLRERLKSAFKNCDIDIVLDDTFETSLRIMNILIKWR